MARVESRRDARAAAVDQVGEGRVLRPPLTPDGAGEDPRMAVGHPALAPGFQRQDPPPRGIEFIHRAGHYNPSQWLANASTVVARKRSMGRSRAISTIWSTSTSTTPITATST